MSNWKETAIRWFGHRVTRRAKGVRRLRARTTVLRLESLEPRLALSGLNLTFKIENPNYDTSNTYVTFIGGSLQATYNGGTAVNLNQSYKISDLHGPINLTSYTDGRIFVSLGNGVAGTAAPEMVNPSIPSYHVRHDKFELTYYGESNVNSVANLTAVDFFGIPLAMNTYRSGSPTPTDTLTYHVAADTLISELAPLSGNSSEVLLTDNGNFLRVLAPHTTTLSGTPHYLSLQPYIDAVKAWQTEAHAYTTIEGVYSRAGSTPATQTQDYFFRTTIEQDGSLKLVGGGQKVGGGQWSGSDHTIHIAAAGLAQAIYLGNVAWTVDGQSGSFADNDVYAAAVRDVLAGFNLGFMASATVDPNTGVAFGAESSKFWWSSTQAFSYLQPNHVYYNQYAQTVTSNSDAYSWAFSDRWSHVQASLYNAETLEIVVLPDAAVTATTGLYAPGSSTFYLRNSNTSGNADTTFGYGPADGGWTPIAGDWSGAGPSTVGLYDPHASTFYLKNANTGGGANVTFGYGPAGGGWTPLAGDWSHAGKQTVGVYDPTSSTFYLKNSNTSGYADLVFGYGPAAGGWTPIVGDWDGDGQQTVGLYDPAESTFYLRNSNTSGYSDTVFQFQPAGTGGTPIVGDWNGDGVETVGLYNPTTSTFYLKNSHTGGNADVTFAYGAAGAGWKPLAGNWTGAALMAADGELVGSDATRLAQADLQPIVDQAISRWVAAGLDADAAARLRGVEIVIADLSGSQLGQAAGTQIYIDQNAAGHGWFVDPTPAVDEEFATSESSAQLAALDPWAADRIDLQTVVEHELGHIAGFSDLASLTDNVMNGSLSTGIRRSPELVA